MSKTLEQIHANLKYGTAAHDKLRDHLQSCLKMSRDKMSTRYDAMAQSEELYSAYVSASDLDTAKENKKKDGSEQTFTTINVPYAYAAVMTMHTYISSVFLSRSPTYQVSARHGETEMSVQSMEALLDYQFVAGNHAMPLYIALFDPLKYGFSVVGQYWDEQTTRVREFVDQKPTFLGVEIPGSKSKRVATVRDIPGYRGTTLYNVRPQDFFPDTRYPLWQFQKGEFCGRYFELAWGDLAEDRRRYFNIQDALENSKTGGTSGTGFAGGRDLGSSNVSNVPGSDDAIVFSEKPTSLFKGHEVQIRLDPKRWGLGDETRREIWIFEMSEGGVIVSARPSGVYHGNFSYDVFMYEPDGYNLLPTAAIERIKPLNDTLSWLINTHFYNVRASLNNKFVVDPSRVVMKDLLNRDAGGIIRLKPEAYGSDLRQSFYQVPTSDVTRSHLSDAQVVEMMIQRTLGSTDNVMGMLGTGGRKTATEVRTSTSFGVNRLKTPCEIASACGFTPMLAKMVANTQQFYAGDQKYRLVGDLAQLGETARTIDPESIAGFYDYVPVDGTLPVDRYAQVQLWQNLMAQAQKMPQVAMQYDMGKIFAWVAALGGLKNIQQFKIQVGDPAALAQQAAAGNMVPINDATKDLTRVPDSGRAQNMGATG